MRLKARILAADGYGNKKQPYHFDAVMGRRREAHDLPVVRICMDRLGRLCGWWTGKNCGQGLYKKESFGSPQGNSP